jgi:peptidoglycan/LPS O-acetylase OafA/YrhL
LTARAQPPAADAPDSFPGFDAIRLLAAWAVVFSHSYPIARGPETADPLIAVIGDRLGFGDYAVQVFFILSGFLLSASLSTNLDPLRYLANRLFRIVPGFCFAIVASVLVIAPFLTSQSFRVMATSSTAWASIYWSISSLTDVTSFTLSAVRYPDLSGFLNGSLWSIPYELVYYLVLLCLYLLLRKDSRVAVAALVLSIVAIAGPRLGLTTIEWSHDTPGLARLPMAMFDHTLPYFCGGVAFYAVHRRWGAPRGLVWSAWALLIGGAFLGVHDVVLAFAGPVILTRLGSRRGLLARLTETTGDVSYGVYLFGWPVGLLVVAMTGTTNPVAAFALSIPLVFAFAYAMHVFVEVPVSAHAKPWVFRWLPRFRLGAPASPSFAVRATRTIAYLFCLVMMLRFAIYPYRFGANWFGDQVAQLLGISVAIGLLLKAGEYGSTRRTSPAVPPAR